MTSATLGEAVATIGNEAFKHCSGLTGINIPNGVTAIGDRAFESCSGLESVTIGEGVTAIGTYAFYVCPKLLTVTSMRPTAIPLPSDAFSTFNKATLNVPYGSYDSYKQTDYWGQFYRILEMPKKLRGDANENGEVTTADISALVDHMLNGSYVNPGNADCDNSGTIDPADISALIDYLLNGTWGDEQQ